MDRFNGALPNICALGGMRPYLCSLLTLNLLTMKTILLIKEIYSDGFRNLGNYLIRNYFKAFAWFSFIMLAVVLYAFSFRVFTGFAFD